MSITTEKTYLTLVLKDRANSLKGVLNTLSREKGKQGDSFALK